MKIAIYTLTPQRDKYIDGLLADELRALGHEVVVRAYIYAARESICYEKPDAIIHPMVGGEYKMDTIEKCREWGIQVIVRRGEAGQGLEQFGKLDDNRKTLMLGNWDYSPHVDLELVWGEEFRNILIDHGKIPASKVKACGAFAFDPYFAPDSKRFKKTGKKVILFATGFSTADSDEGYCETGLPEGSDYHNELHKIHKNARLVWVDAIAQLVKDHSDIYDFELKVRPGETSNVYNDLVPECVKIHPEGSPSSEVLKSVDVLVHSGSTLAIEAHLLDIPSFNFFNINPDPLLSKVSPMMELYTELEYSLRRAVRSGHTNIIEPIYQELQEHLYGKIDGMACKRAAGFVHEHLKGKVINNTSPWKWPADPKYFVKSDGLHLEKQGGDTQWQCPCCRNIFYGENIGTHNCPYCNMKIARTKIEANAVAK